MPWHAYKRAQTLGADAQPALFLFQPDQPRNRGGRKLDPGNSPCSCEACGQSSSGSFHRIAAPTECRVRLLRQCPAKTRSNNLCSCCYLGVSGPSRPMSSFWSISNCVKNEEFAPDRPGRFYFHLRTIGGMAECRFCTWNTF